jgi:carboxypeptidase E
MCRRYLAESYAEHHATMADPNRIPCEMTGDDSFGKQGGITNGARWYSVKNGTYTTVMSVTLVRTSY